MATPETAASNKKNEEKKNGGVVENNEASAASSAKDDGWREIAVDRPMYKPDLCKKTALRGYLIDLIPMPETDNGPWSAYVFKLTAPCLAVDGFDESGEAKDYPAGSEVLLNETVKLRGQLSRLLNPNVLIEVEVKPLEKVKLGGGRTMWIYQIRANEKSMKKRTAIHTLRQNNAVPVAAAVQSMDDIPF